MLPSFIMDFCYKCWEIHSRMQQHEKNQHFFFLVCYQKLGVRLIHVCAVYTRLYGTCSCGGPQKIIFLFFPHFWSLRWSFRHHRLCRFHLITLWKTYSFQGRCPWTPQGALPLDPARGAAPRTPRGRCPWTPLGALPPDPRHLVTAYSNQITCCKKN